jgi:hypothetical protein
MSLFVVVCGHFPASVRPWERHRPGRCSFANIFSAAGSGASRSTLRLPFFLEACLRVQVLPHLWKVGIIHMFQSVLVLLIRLSLLGLCRETVRHRECIIGCTSNVFMPTLQLVQRVLLLLVLESLGRF